MVDILKELGFLGGHSDPCLYTRTNKKGTVIVIMYVDDFLCVGDHDALDKLGDDLSAAKLFLKVEHGLSDYISCKTKTSHQPPPTRIGPTYPPFHLPPVDLTPYRPQQTHPDEHTFKARLRQS